VRSRARLALEQQLDRSPATTVGIAAPVALLLGDRDRGRWLTERLRDLLRTADPDVLASVRAAADGRTRREGFSASIERNVLSLDDLIQSARTDHDLPLRRMCARAAVSTARADNRQDALRPLLQSGTASVRADVLQALGEMAAAQSALADVNPLVRAVAQAITRRGGQDVRDTYVEMISTAPTAGAVAGLGEVGQSDDSQLLLPLLADPLAPVRAEAVRALRRLGRATVDLLFPMLSDESARVARQAAQALRPIVAQVDLEALRSLVDAENQRHTRTAAYRLLRERDIYVRLVVDLQLLNDSTSELAARAKADIQDWLTRVAPTAYEPPSGALREELAQRLAQEQARLGPAVTRTLRFHLRLPGTA
jgi:HEAT repeat protein